MWLDSNIIKLAYNQVMEIGGVRVGDIFGISPGRIFF